MANQSQKLKVSGVLLIDKPKGMTSQQVVSKVKYLFKSPAHNSKKAGHTGTLDPMATGLLPICLGEATKFSHYQLNADKSYQAIIKLGERTDTGDAEGEVIATADVPIFTKQDLDNTAQQFIGNIMQIPPMYSALKKNGKKLYEYAREGKEIKRPARPITIKSLTLDKISNNELLLNVTCSKGTYVRVLGEDIAKALGTGTLGHLTMLRRTATGHFDITNAITIDELESMDFDYRLKQLQGIDACLEDMTSLTLDDSQITRLRLGQRLNVQQQFDDCILTLFNTDEKKQADIRLLSPTGEFVGLGLLEANGRLQPKKMVVL
ncbi:MAG: tRNA pseudouridine(55) synthase TruB [Gammaproteobacteria bacterium]|nr:MAG: tRNA pseudouridine(55) synthase TruB [Gammaproteobacteria bacterium]